ncbi:MAG: hypothetical protein ACE367_09600 [Acidimicrobiales bacterium]
MSVLDRFSTAQRRAIERSVPWLLAVAGAALFIIGFAITTTGEPDQTIVTSNPAIEELIPAPGSEVLSQSQVGIDLVAGYTAQLFINGTPIPLDEVNVLRDVDDPQTSADQAATFDTTLNRFLYQPLTGRAVPELVGGENCAVAEFWPIADPEAVERVEWCFAAL